MRRGIAILLTLVLGLLMVPRVSMAAPLTIVRDTITNSAPGGSGGHTIEFTTASTVPASGKIVIEFETGGITNLATLNYLDADVASSSDYSLAAVPSGGTLGVTFTGTVMTVTLGGTAISAGTAITVRLGSAAVFQAAGDTDLTNSATTGDYRIAITTKTAANAVIDTAETVFVVITPVGIDSGPTPAPGGGGGGATPTPTPLVTSIELWPASYETLTISEFAVSDVSEVAAILGLSVDELSALLSLSPGSLTGSMGMAQVAALAGESVATLYDDLNVIDARFLIAAPAPQGGLPFADFAGESASTVAAALDLTVEEFYAVLSADYPAMLTSVMTGVASDLGMTPGDLYDALMAQFPQLNSVTSAQFASMTVQQLAAVIGINIGELYGALNLEMTDVASLANVSHNALYDDLAIAYLQFESVPPVSFPETSIGATVSASDGEVQLGVGGEPYDFITDTAGALGLASIESGDWLFTTYAQATDNGGTTSLTAQIWVLSVTGEETLLFEQLITSDLSPTLTAYQTVSNQAAFDIDPGDRLVLRYLVDATGGNGTVTVTLTIGGTDHYSFVQSPPTELEIPVPCFRIADFVSGPRESELECRVNVYDLSIMMYNWPAVRNRTDTDLNTDGRVGIIDFSVLLYWWTG